MAVTMICSIHNNKKAFAKQDHDEVIHYVKSVQIRSFFWSVLSCVYTEYGDLLVNLRIQSEYKKIQTRKNSIFRHFSHSDN